MKITDSWLRKKSSIAPDVEPEAGLIHYSRNDVSKYLRETIAQSSSSPEEKSLGPLLKLLRQRDEVSMAELANQIKVRKEELSNIETDPSYVPKARTIFQIAAHYGFSTTALSIVSGVVQKKDPRLSEAADHIKFATHSNISQLSFLEKKELSKFVKLLSSYKEDSVPSND